MRALISPNAFKGSLSAAAAARAMERGVHRACNQCRTQRLPVADGGDGLAQVLADSLAGERREERVAGPLGDPTSAALVWLPERRLAVIEMALASGLALVPPQRRNPMHASTKGTGQLMRAALDLGARHLVIGVGGSATNDGGTGMAAALGAKFRDAQGQLIEPNGATLSAIRDIDLSGLDPRIAKTRIEVVCDVDNPLTGPAGAAAVYAPQKGASPEQVAELDAGLANLAACIRAHLGSDVEQLPGAGAAGGLGGGLKAFVGAELRPGTELVLDLLDFDAALEGVDLVLTGEGRIDGQTAHGKAPAGVAARAKAKGIPCIGLAGSLGDDIADLHQIGFSALFSLSPGPMRLEQSMDQAGELLARASEQILRTLLAGRREQP